MSRIVLALYSLVLGIGLPLYRLRRRFGRRPVAPAAARSRDFPRRADRPVIWLHAVSVGEILAARALLEELARAWPDHEILISTTTRAGMAMAEREYPGLRRFYCPYDLAGPVRRALAALRPDLLVLVELELWPRLLDECRRRGLPVVLVNGKLSESSARGYRRLLRLLPRLLEPVRLLAVQNEDQARRFAALGDLGARIRVTGNIKVDNLPPTPSPEDGRKLRLSLGFGDAPLFLAGSTHEGEDEAVLDATLAIRSEMPNCRLVLAPRHLERLPAIEAAVRDRGLVSVRKSAPCRGDETVLLVDTMGELAGLFAAADLVFLGGSLVPRGGHNLLEPAAAGRMQIVGPWLWTVAETAAELEAAGALAVVPDAGSLGPRARGLLCRGPEERKRAAEAARAVVERHRGATARTVKVMKELDLLRSR
ncbi:MAG: 3-deoxy-D-manno-octulosonic acid transferase [Planctomycetes bacterium]|nr:3-deoxy-D-manno-octulosonic acid transferase [Planctomycetota bacterium]